MLTVMPAHAAVNDVFPADFTALPEGRTVATYYAYDRHQQGTWVNGQRTGDLDVSSSIAALRLSSSYRLGTLKISPVAVFSAADTDFSGRVVPSSVTPRRSGLGDLKVGATAWFIEVPEARRYLGLNLMTVWGTGRYDGHELANIGENRRRQALTLGWIEGIGKYWTIEPSPEVAWYGTNKAGFPGNVRVDQSRMESVAGYVRRRFSPALEGFIGFQANEGG